MKPTNWKDIAELIGIGAIIASLLFVGLQLRQEQDIAISQVYADWDDTRIEWSRLLADNEDTWLKGLAGGKLDEKEALRFQTLADVWFHMEFGRWVRAGRISLANPDNLALRAAVFVHTNPGMKDWWDRMMQYRREVGPSVPGYARDVDSLLKQCESGALSCPKSDFSIPL